MHGNNESVMLFKNVVRESNSGYQKVNLATVTRFVKVFFRP